MEKLRFLLVTIMPRKVTEEQILLDLTELQSLVETYGGNVSDIVVQKREVHDKGMYIGEGKLLEVKEKILSEKIDVIVLNAIVKPGHIYAILQQLEKTKKDIKVWDRVDLILEIFASHANTAEAKLQIELASMRHMGPRIYGMGMIMSRQGGGIGTLGVGETNTELMKRHWRVQMKKTKDRIQKHVASRERQMARRKKNGVKTISLIGYTNAGKTSLFNLLTGKTNIVQNALFVTLDSSTGRLYFPKERSDILLSDTIGFIRNLPPALIDAFRSTLLESIYADLLLLIIDASDKNMKEKIQTVENVLKELKLQNKKRLYVFNKIEEGRVNQKKLQNEYRKFYPQFISVKQKKGIEALLKEIERELHTETPYKIPVQIKLRTIHY